MNEIANETRCPLVMDSSLKVISLFDGISCGRLAFERADLKVGAYAAFEIDKYAKGISRYNYPDIMQCGNVLEADFTHFIGYDYVIGGSPCTFWSIAKQNREIDKSGMGWQLFMGFVNAMRIIKPKWFLYENVASMPNSIKEYITQELQVSPVLINSALVSAQQRKRLYWTNIQGITQPSDKGILLKDILESGVTPKVKSHCIDASYYKGGNHSSPEKQSGKRFMVYEPIALVEKAQTIPATIYKENALSMLMRSKTGLFCVQRVSERSPNAESDFCEAKALTVELVNSEVSYGAALRTREDEAGRFKRLEVRNDEKINALTTVLTDSMVCEPVRIGSIGKGGQGDRIYSVHGKTVCISATSGGTGSSTGLYKVDLPDGDYIIRKLSPIEAERCQTLPDNYTAFGIDDNGKAINISNTQRYKCVGNGWTVDVIAHILGFSNKHDQ